MNICFLSGIINSEIEFDFLFNSKKHISIASFFILHEDFKIKAVCYDEIADYIYSKCSIGKEITIRAEIREDYLEIFEILVTV